MNRRLLFTLAAFVLVAGTSVAIFFYARGLKFNPEEKRIEKTGMVLVKSRPDGAKIFFDNELITATPSTLSGLKPGQYNLTLIKEGYSKWEKDVSVQEGLVTSVSALLISQTPELKPLTSTGAYSPITTDQQNKIAFKIKKGSKTGIGILNLENTTLPLIKTSANQIIPDTKQASYSAAKSMQWSPLGTELLVEVDESRSYLIKTDVSGPNKVQQADPKITINNWQKEEEEIKSLLANRFKLTEEVKKIATSSATKWSPDENKFLTEQQKNGTRKFIIYNFEKPLSVGEQEKYTPLELDGDDPSQVIWYSDSEHLLLVNKDSIRIVEKSGTNITTMYSGRIEEALAVPFPKGDKIVILTKFKETGEPNLYSLSLQ